MRIAIVTPRYGPDVAGGAERLAREYAVRLAEKMDVTVLTTCARDYTTWADEFPSGASHDGPVTVMRFSVPRPREPKRFAQLCGSVLAGADRGDEETWMDAQGPNAPGLLDHLRTQGGTYDAVIFVPYLYATTVRGAPLVRDRAILVPALHDEPWLRLEIFRDVIENAQALIFSTPEEHELAQSRFAINTDRVALVGVGVDAPPPGTGGSGDSRPYLVCVGRVDPSKGVDDLLRSHRALYAAVGSAPDLCLLGPPAMPLPDEPWLRAPGFVSEQEKNATIAGALALVCPSPYESLSLVLLEAWSHGVPTLCAAGSPVLVGQSRRSGGGLWYSGDDEYIEAVRFLATNPAVAGALGTAGRRFTQTLTWESITSRLSDVVTRVANDARGARRVSA